MKFNSRILSFFFAFLAVFSLSGCGGGGDDSSSPPIPPWEDKIVGDRDGVYSDTYYNNSLDFTMTVPEEWSIQGNGSFRDGNGKVEGQISAEPKTGSFKNSVDNYNNTLKGQAHSYQEIYDLSRMLDSNSIRIVKCELETSSSSPEMVVVTVHLDKGNRIARVVFKVLSSQWSNDISNKISQVIGTITRKNSPAGLLRRALNQFEYAYESEDLDYYWTLLADSVYTGVIGISRSEFLSRREEMNRKVRKALFDDYRWELDFFNLREISPGASYVSCTVDLLMSQFIGNSLYRGGKTVIDRPTFISERGLLRLCGEKVLGGGSWGKRQIFYNPSENSGPVANFSVRADGLKVYVDASSSYDPDNSTSSLEVRWDWTNNYSWDTSWSKNKETSHTYSSAGTYLIKVEVRDLLDKSQTFVLPVRVEGGGGKYEGNLVWAKKAGGTGGDAGFDISTFSDGSYVVSGVFRGTAYFGSTKLISSGGGDIFVAKYDSKGDVLWAKKAGGGTGSDHGYGISTFSDGSCVVTGEFLGTADFGSTKLFSSGSIDVFVAKYSSTGSVLWAKKAGGSLEDAGYEIATFSDGSCVVTGTFEKTAYFGSAKLISSGSLDIFVAKYDSKGDVLWAKKAGGSSWEVGKDISTFSDGSCVVTGRMEGTVYFGSIRLTTSGREDIFVAKYDSKGDVLWAKKAGGSLGNEGNGISTFSDGSCVVTGYFHGTAHFGSAKLISSGSSDIFVAKYSSTGSVLWAKKAGGSLGNEGNGISTFSDGSCVVTGYFHGTAYFGSAKLISSGSLDIFVAKYDSKGDVLWAKKAGGSSWEVGKDISTFSDGSCVVTGYFRGTAYFGSAKLISSGGGDIFVAKYSK